ncbi:MAG: hypothetical protein M0P01_14040 [Treponema sp.]|nr:hypothetical protein [Treponema sp.]
MLVSAHNDETVDTPIEDHLQNYDQYAVKVKNDKDGNSYNVTGEESHHDLYFVITEKF